MAKSESSGAPIVAHGGIVLPSVTVDAVNVELRDGDGFVGDRASNGAFFAIIEAWRERLEKAGIDPFGDVDTDEIGKSRLAKVLTGDDLEAAALVQGALEEFAGELTSVIRRFGRLKEWKDIQRIVVGGGFRAGRLGELVIARAAQMLVADGAEMELVPIRSHPDEAGLLGAIHLAPSWILAGHECMFAADIGGTNIRAGVVRLGKKKSADLSKAKVWKSTLWRHADDAPGREEAVGRLADMLNELIDEADSEDLAMAPFIGIGCPGLIGEDGSIERGGQNLPGNWESSRFNLPTSLREAIPRIGDHETAIVMHNDAVVQGLSEAPAMRDVARWGVLTIGTGLGNACFTNRNEDDG